MQGHRVQQFWDSDEYVVGEFTFTQNDSPMPFGTLSEKILSLPIMRIEQMTFFSPTSFKKNVQEVIQKDFV